MILILTYAVMILSNPSKGFSRSLFVINKYKIMSYFCYILIDIRLSTRSEFHSISLLLGAYDFPSKARSISSLPLFRDDRFCEAKSTLLPPPLLLCQAIDFLLSPMSTMLEIGPRQDRERINKSLI